MSENKSFNGGKILNVEFSNKSMNTEYADTTILFSGLVKKSN